MRILHLDDDPIQLEVARRWLEAQGHVVIGHARGVDALKAVERDSFDLAILDWMLPDVSGEEVLRWIRKRNHGVPILFATANDEEAEIAHILGLGADDYLVKPLRRLEFLARVEALGRRRGYGLVAAGDVAEIGPYSVDMSKGRIALDGEGVPMTPRMAQVALLLFRKRGELVSRAQIYEEVWGHREQLQTRSVDTHVSRVRSALQLDGRHGWRLSSVYQHGYRLEPV
jgi:two-component system response regulator RegX3